MTRSVLPTARNRDEMIRFFDGYAAERVEELDERKLRKPLVKTHLVELLNGRRVCEPADLQAVFGRRGVQVEPMEDGLFLVTDPHYRENSIGYMELLRPRILALYSTLKGEDLDPWMRRIVYPSPELDHVWLSGLTFGVLWQLVVRLSRPQRFTRLVFTHESIFQVDGSPSDREDDSEEAPGDSADDEVEVRERRATSFRLVDRVGVIQSKLAELQRLYAPLYAISQLRFPSPVGRGGHDFYDNGRVTNRSESFRDHRNHLLFVVRIYERLLTATEDQAWYSIRESVSVPGQFRSIVGAPVTIRFQEALSPEVFDYWVAATFERPRNRFRLWGHPIRLGPTKVHVYGVDRHLWQPIFLELTAHGCTAILPRGTCGNTVHRLVSNVQRFLDPGAKAYIGNKTYDELVQDSARGVPYDV